MLDGETVLLDAGTTVARAARHLRDRATLTLVTKGLTALAEVVDGEADVLVLGGHLRRISQGLVGPLAELSLGGSPRTGRSSARTACIPSTAAARRSWRSAR